MQRKYLATALAGLLVAPAGAMAAGDGQSVMSELNIKVHAHLHGSVDYSDTGGASVPNDISYGEAAGTPSRALNMSNNNSNIGFTGEHLVPGAFMAIFQVELALPGSQTGVNNSYGRGNHVSKNVGLHDTYFGIANPLGVLLFQPSFENQGAFLSRPFNMFKDTVGDFNSIIDTANFPNGGPSGEPAISFAGQANYAMSYTSPKWNGVDSVISYTEDANGGDFGTYNTYGVGYIAGSGESYGYPNANQHNNAWSWGIRYGKTFNDTSAIKGLINYSQINVQGNTTGIEKYISALSKSVPVSYDSAESVGQLPPSDKMRLKALELAASYEYIPSGTTAIAVWERSNGLYTRDAYSLGLSQAVPGNNDLMASWIHAGDLSSPMSNCAINATYSQINCSGGKVEDSGANEYVVGMKHHFDKQVSMYLVYAYTRNGKNGLYGLGGPNHGQSIYPTKAGDDPKSLSMGMIWDF